MRRQAFTLIEMLASISIIVLLVAILLPAMSGARRAAQRAACASNLHQLALVTQMYHDDYRGYFWRYYVDDAAGRGWWFGYEAGGPNSGKYRPLDKSRSVMARYLATDRDVFNCPSFPYDQPTFYPKFERRAASYGFNLVLGPSNAGQPTAHRDKLLAQASTTMVFADGIHFDSASSFNEGHYILRVPTPTVLNGYAHYRHDRTAQGLMLDGHVQLQRHSGTAYAVIADGPAANF